VKKLTLFVFLIALALCHSPVEAQHRLHTKPPAPADPTVNSDITPKPAGARIDLLEIQREATELAKTAQSIPLDVESVRKGMLPKDVLQKLKQIEKISKHLRSELNP
jgi:hypothetical protein